MVDVIQQPCLEFYSDAHRLDFQIKLYETGGVNSSRIEFVYRDQNPVCINTGYSYQID